jgi:hypothetical protein
MILHDTIDIQNGKCITKEKNKNYKIRFFFIVLCRDDLFSSCLTDFSLFSSDFFSSKVTGHSQIRSKMDLIKGSEDVLSYFSLIYSYFIFYSELSKNLRKIS